MAKTSPDSLHGIDARYRRAEQDAELELVPEEAGSRRIGLAVVGVGRMGAIHLYNAVREPRANLLYVLDSSPDRLAYMQKKYFLDERGVNTVLSSDWHKLLADKRVEALLISTPTFTHEQYTREALEAGKHVLCEKPLAEKPEQVAALMELAERNKLKLVCAFQRRYDPSFRRIKELSARGELGELRIIKTCSRDSPLPPIEYIKISGGLFHDCLVHDADLIMWVARQLPVEVHAFAHCYDPEYAELNDHDTALVTMKFASGLMAVSDLARVSSSGYDQRMEVYGAKGCVKVDECASVVTERHGPEGVSRPSNCYSFASRYETAYAVELVELFNHIEGNQVLEPIKQHYLGALCKVIQACEESALQKKPVSLQWTAEEIEKAFE